MDLYCSYFAKVRVSLCIWLFSDGTVDITAPALNPEFHTERVNVFFAPFSAPPHRMVRRTEIVVLSQAQLQPQTGLQKTCLPTLSWSMKTFSPARSTR